MPDTGNTRLSSNPSAFRQKGFLHPFPWLFVRVVVALVLIGILFDKVDWKDFQRVFQSLDLRWALLGFLGVASMRLLMAYKWHQLIKEQVGDVRLSQAVAMSFISDFLASFLPSGIGTDATKAVLIAQSTAERTRAVSSVIMDRFIGIWVLMGMGALALFFSPISVHHRELLLVLIVTALLSSILALALLLKFRVQARERLSRIPSVGHYACRITARLLFSIHQYWGKPGLLIRVAMLAVVMNASRILYNYFFGKALGDPTDILIHAAFVPIIFAVNQLPITIDSLGVREGLYVYLYGLVGMPAGVALAIALLTRFSGYVVSLPGAILYVRSGVSASARNLKCEAVSSERAG